MVQRVFGLFMIAVLLVSASTALAAPIAVDDDTDRTIVRSNPHDKIHPNLQRDIDQALQASSGPSLRSATPDKSIQFMARVKADTNLDAYADEWFTRPFIDPLGNTVAIGSASPNGLIKMAAQPDVLTLQRPESLVETPRPIDPDTTRILNAGIERTINRAPTAGPAPEGWYHTGSAIHGSQEAWERGYTGKDVRYMSNDSGADYCHPDLLGTWAYIENPASPYYGLPQMFDSYSSYLASQDYYLGTDFVASGQADYADTSTTVQMPPSFVWRRLPVEQRQTEYQPIGAPEARTYLLPGTSRSGLYKFGSHPDKALAQNAQTLSEEFGDGTAAPNERAAVLVVDLKQSEVYDLVYVDLNYNYDFTDDTPARVNRGAPGIGLAGSFGNKEAACLDYNDDGLNDVSGGLVYFIADGETAIPTLDWYWGVPGDTYGNGDLVAFHVMDYTEGGGDHGMGTTSVAVGQGVVSGSTSFGPDGPPQAEGQGLVVGPGKDVESTQNGNYYVTPFIEDAYIYAGLGYDGISGTDDDIQIVSNSWGFSGTDNDGFDDNSRLIDYINRTLAPNTALLFSTGNGAAAYGTVAPPSPTSGIGIGASTLYGSIGLFEPIESSDQIVGGDVISWSNRGPGARNTNGADVVATGAFGTGSVSLNQVLDGAIATDNFGGTSMAAPVAAGNLALIYQAWYERTGEWPTFDEAKALLMGTAKDTSHDTWSQGAGLVDADRGTEAASGLDGVYATPVEWSVGDYRGEEYEAFAHIIEPGESDTQSITLWNHSGNDQEVSVSTSHLVKIGTTDYSFTSLDQSLDHGLFTTPDYVFRIDEDIPEGTELLQVRVTKPYEQFDPDDNLSEPFNNWRVHLQDWTDLDEDGLFWDDANDDGKVTVEFDAEGNMITNEMDTGEHIRFTYGYNTGPTQQARIANPLDRMTDGILLTFRHRNQVESVPTTDLTVEVSYWKSTDWDWVDLDRTELTVPDEGSTTFDATISIPEETPYGMYQGAIKVDDGESTVIVPVTTAVAATGPKFTFGGNAPADTLYDNSHVFGYTDYGWRAESGDWRFFWTDVTADDVPESGTPYLVVDTTWSGDQTDIDTLVMGPTTSIIPPNLVGGEEGIPYPTDIYGPYTLETVGGSVNTHGGSGRWRFETSSGESREIVAAPAAEGLHGIFLHQVKVDGEALDEPFEGKTGLVTVDPGEIEVVGDLTGSTSISVSSQLDLEELVAEGFGISKPEITRETAQQDDPDDPLSASVVKEVEISNGALLEVTTDNLAFGSDLDLFVYGPDNTLLASSTTPDGEESVSITFPEDGTYTIRVQGWSVPSGTDQFDLTINAIQGTNLTITDMPEEILADETGVIDISWDATGNEPGTYVGLVLMGPEDAPGLLSVPVEITIESE